VEALSVQIDKNVKTPQAKTYFFDEMIKMLLKPISDPSSRKALIMSFKRILDNELKKLKEDNVQSFISK